MRSYLTTPRILAVCLLAAAVAVGWLVTGSKPKDGGTAPPITLTLRSDSLPSEAPSAATEGSDRLAGVPISDGVGGSSGLGLSPGDDRASIAPSRASEAGVTVEFVAVLVVQDLRTGAPVSEATALEVFVGEESLHPDRDWRATESTEEGRLELVVRLRASTETAAGEPKVDVLIGAGGYSTAVVAGLAVVPDGEATEGAPGASPPEPTRLVQLERAASLVLDVVGAPSNVEGELALWFSSAARRDRSDMSLAWPIHADGTQPSAVTVESGSGGSRRVRFEGLAPGPLSVALAVEGYPLALQQSLTLLSGEPLHSTVELVSGETASGVVVDLVTGRPVAGVEVIVTPGIPGISEKLDRRPYPPPTTDSAGRFEIAGLPRGSLGVELITVDGANHPRQIKVVEGNHARRHELRVRGAASLAGRVEPPPGLTLAGLEVFVTTAEAASSVRWRRGSFEVRGPGGPGVLAQVDLSTGEFLAETVPSGRRLVVHAMAKSSTHGTASVGSLKLGQRREDIVIRLAERHPTPFRVVSTTGEAIREVRASFFGPRHAGDEIEASPAARKKVRGKKRRAGGVAGSRWLPWKTLEADAAGVFVADPPIAAIERVRLRWGTRAKGEFEWSGGGADAMPTFELTPDPVILFEVLGSDGLAVRGARVLATPDVESGVDGSRKRRRTALRATTDAFGRARLALGQKGDGQPVADRFVARVVATGYAPAEGLILRLQDAIPAPATEVLLERAERVVPAEITGRLTRKNGEPIAAPRFDGLRGGSAHVDEHAFTLRGLRPGRTRIVVHASGFESVKLDPVQLRAGERHDVGEITMNWASIVDVKVKDSKGKPARKARVRLTRLPEKETQRTDLPRSLEFPGAGRAPGVFRRTAVPRTKWRLEVRLGRHKLHRQVIRVKKALEVIEVKMLTDP